MDDGGINLCVRAPDTREWLEDIIPNLVEFPLKKFNVYILTNRSGAPGLADDRSIILVDIPDSDDAPHQARDHKYYARVGGKSRPVGHRLVTDMFHRQRHARFDVQFAFESRTWIPRPILLGVPFGGDRKPQREVRLLVAAANRGRVYAKYTDFHLWIPEHIVAKEDRDEDSLCEIEGGRYYLRQKDNTRRDVLAQNAEFGTKTYGPSWFDPILPGLCRTWDFECEHRLQPSHLKSGKLLWRVHCDNAPAMSGEKSLGEIPFAVRDEHEMC